MPYIDLHVHSNASDGTLTPAALVDHAVEKGVVMFALTDHDTTAGIDEAMARAAELRKEGRAITVLPGTEISAAYNGRDIHILGLLIDHRNKELNKNLEKALNDRDVRNEKMLKNFNDLGIDITMEDLLFNCPADTVITRAHFANALTRKGYVKDNNEAFQKYLDHETGSCFVPREYMQPEEAIRNILSAGGVPVLAHPLIYKLPHEELIALVKRLKAAGLVGIETFYSKNQGADEDTIRGVAAHFGLIMTGGSDFHGATKPGLEIGCGYGTLNVPHYVLPPLFNASSNTFKEE